MCLGSTADRRRTLPFSEAEKVRQASPYIYTTGTVPLTEKGIDYLFYQTWTDGRVKQQNLDVWFIQFETNVLFSWYGFMDWMIMAGGLVSQLIFGLVLVFTHNLYAGDLIV
jgi:hypothetical protein